MDGVLMGGRRDSAQARGRRGRGGRVKGKGWEGGGEGGGKGQNDKREGEREQRDGQTDFIYFFLHCYHLFLLICVSGRTRASRTPFGGEALTRCFLRRSDALGRPGESSGVMAAEGPPGASSVASAEGRARPRPSCGRMPC